MARSSAKSPEAFRTISEAADALDLPQHVLRFWETRFSQIKPMKRSGGRRYYRPNDIALLQGIRHLLYDEGYTIKGVQRILREQGIAHVVDAGQGAAPAPSQPAPPSAATPATKSAPAPVPNPAPETVAQPVPADPVHASPQPYSPQATDPVRPDPVRAALSAPIAPGGGSLRFVPDPPPTPGPYVVAAPPPVAEAPPQPTQAPVTTPPAAAPTAAAPLVPPPSAAPLPPPTIAPQPIPASAPSASSALTAHQSEALVNALRTLMDCKAQLDAARPGPVADS